MAGGMFDVATDASELVELLTAFEKRGGDLSPILAVIAEDLVTAVSDRYDSEGGGEWPPHAPSTTAKRRGGGGRLLQDTGVLAASTEARSGQDFAEATTGVDYIVYHLDGGPIIPKRNPFELGDDVFDAAVDEILAYVLEGS